MSIYTTKTSWPREGDKSVVGVSDNVALLNFEEPDAQRNEDVTGDQSKLNHSKTSLMTAHGSGVSRGDQVPNALLSASTEAIRPAKTFAMVIGPRQKPGSVTCFDVAASLYNVHEDSTMDITKSSVEIFPVRSWFDLYLQRNLCHPNFKLCSSFLDFFPFCNR